MKKSPHCLTKSIITSILFIGLALANPITTKGESTMNFDELVEQVKTFEGFSATPYRDSANVLTIGYGRTTGITTNEKTTKEKESQWLKSELTKRMNTVKQMMLNYGYNCTDNEILALTDFAYNLGCGKITQLTNNGHRTKEEIASKILQYDKAKVNGKLTPLKGLTKRRKWEYDLFISDNIVTAKDLQRLCNELDKNVIPLVVDGIVGPKTINRCYELLKGGALC